jgi:thymidylate synthase
MFRPDVYGEIGYLELLEKILETGDTKGDRTGVGTRSLFGEQVKFDLSESFPLLTTKSMPIRWIAEELLWFLRGETTVFSLQAAKVDIWDEWATESATAKFGRPEGHLGPIYGHQWRNWGGTLMEDGLTYSRDGFDQLMAAIQLIKNTPDSRRIIVSAWNPLEALKVTLPPCHSFFQFGVANGKLSLHLYMRSADYFLGVPFNIASYALLCHMIAHVTGLQVGKLIVSFGDVHLYNNQIEQAELQLTRSPLEAPQLSFARTIDSIDGFRVEDIVLSGYKHQGKITAEVAV